VSRVERQHCVFANRNDPPAGSAHSIMRGAGRIYAAIARAKVYCALFSGHAEFAAQDQRKHRILVGEHLYLLTPLPPAGVAAHGGPFGGPACSFRFHSLCTPVDMLIQVDTTQPLRTASWRCVGGYSQRPVCSNPCQQFANDYTLVTCRFHDRSRCLLPADFRISPCGRGLGAVLGCQSRATHTDRHLAGAGDD